VDQLIPTVEDDNFMEEGGSPIQRKMRVSDAGLYYLQMEETSFSRDDLQVPISPWK
jgi:hypothetical protein